MDEIERMLIEDLSWVFSKHFKLPADGNPFVAFVMAIVKEMEKDGDAPDFDEAELRRYLLEER